MKPSHVGYFCIIPTLWLKKQVITGYFASIIKTRYQNALRELIHKRFNYSPPGDGKDSIIEEIQRLLVEIQSETRDAGLDSSVSKITKINDLLNLLGYNDSNSLLPPSMGREL